MTAETFTATRAASTFPVFKGTGSGIVCAAYGTYALDANVEAGDVYKICRLPAGAVCIGGWIYAADMDTNASPALDMDLGWAANGGSGTYDSADEDGFGNLGVWNGAALNGATSALTKSLSATTGNIFPLSGQFALGLLPTFTKETTVQFDGNAAAGTFSAGSISVVVLYVCP